MLKCLPCVRVFDFSARLRLLLLIIPAGSQSAMCLLKCVVETCDVWLVVCLWVGHLFLPGRRRKTKGLVRMQPSIMLQINSHVQRTTRTAIIIVIIIPAGVEYVNKGKKTDSALQKLGGPPSKSDRINFYDFSGKWNS